MRATNASRSAFFAPDKAVSELIHLLFLGTTGAYSAHGSLFRDLQLGYARHSETYIAFSSPTLCSALRAYRLHKGDAPLEKRSPVAASATMKSDTSTAHRGFCSSCVALACVTCTRAGGAHRAESAHARPHRAHARSVCHSEQMCMGWRARGATGHYRLAPTIRRRVVMLLLPRVQERHIQGGKKSTSDGSKKPKNVTTRLFTTAPPRHTYPRRLSAELMAFRGARGRFSPANKPLPARGLKIIS